jgi:hypothetical protein
MDGFGPRRHQGQGCRRAGRPVTGWKLRFLTGGKGLPHLLLMLQTILA